MSAIIKVGIEECKKCKDEKCCATGFAPIGDVSKNGDEIIINDSCKLLILGTFPGKDSIESRKYYDNDGNVLKKLVFEKYNQDCSKDYNAFIKLLKEHHIVLWDVLKSVKEELH